MTTGAMVSVIYINPKQKEINDTIRIADISIILARSYIIFVLLCDIIETIIFFKSITNKRNNKYVPRRRNESKSDPEKA